MKNMNTNGKPRLIDVVRMAQEEHLNLARLIEFFKNHTVGLEPLIEETAFRSWVRSQKLTVPQLSKLASEFEPEFSFFSFSDRQIGPVSWIQNERNQLFESQFAKANTTEELVALKEICPYEYDNKLRDKWLALMEPQFRAAMTIDVIKPLFYENPFHPDTPDRQGHVPEFVMEAMERWKEEFQRMLGEAANDVDKLSGLVEFIPRLNVENNWYEETWRWQYSSLYYGKLRNCSTLTALRKFMRWSNDKPSPDGSGSNWYTQALRSQAERIGHTALERAKNPDAIRKVCKKHGAVADIGVIKLAEILYTINTPEPQ